MIDGEIASKAGRFRLVNWYQEPPMLEGGSVEWSQAEWSRCGVYLLKGASLFFFWVFKEECLSTNGFDCSVETL